MGEQSACGTPTIHSNYSQNNISSILPTTNWCMVSCLSIPPQKKRAKTPIKTGF